jgi:ribosomal protein L11 methylase PrmA
VVASGIFIDREDDVVGAFRDAGLETVDRSAEGEWVALEARRA